MNPILIKLLVGLALLVGAFVAGVKVESDHRDAQLVVVEQAYIATYKIAVARGNGLAAELEKKKTRIVTNTVTIIQEVPSVTTVYVPTPGAEAVALPPTVFTVGFNRLWNSALDGDSASTGGAVGSPGDADLAPSGLTQAEVLTNHTLNSARWTVCRAQLNALIDYEEGRKDAR